MLYTLLIVAILDNVYFAIDTILHRRSTQPQPLKCKSACRNNLLVHLLKVPFYGKEG